MIKMKNKEEFYKKWEDATKVAEDRYPTTYYIMIGNRSYLRADGYYTTDNNYTPEGYVILMYKKAEIGMISFKRIKDIG